MQMNMNRREFLAAFGTVAAGAVLAGCGNSNATSTDSSSDAKSDEKKGMTLIEDGKLTVVAELGFAPFEYMDEKTGEPVGFDVDVINAVAEKMGLTASYLPNQKFDTLVPIIKQGGKADVSIAAVTITDERMESVDFSEPYLDSNQAIVVAKGSSETEETLNDASKQVVCQGGTTGDEWIGENLPDAVRVPVDDVTAALTGVQTGLYQAMVVDLPVASYMLSQSFSDLEIVKEIPTGEQYGIAVSKDNPELTQAVNKALEDMKSDGTMKEIETKWFGSEI
ncbi:MAG: amino acid ABC transporter substrate-binding protein [Atopobiaceae bacterium]|uniref:amino acid ABC transporter substrate-binding protein n=1 Tax=Paratractidigestivibacter faecalis TaxID=2292441 RepID=UPI003A347A7D